MKCQPASLARERAHRAEADGRLAAKPERGNARSSLLIWFWSRVGWATVPQSPWRNSSFQVCRRVDQGKGLRATVKSTSALQKAGPEGQNALSLLLICREFIVNCIEISFDAAAAAF